MKLSCCFCLSTEEVSLKFYFAVCCHLITSGKMSLSKNNTSDLGTAPVDLSLPAQPNVESQVTTAATTATSHNLVYSQTTPTSHNLVSSQTTLATATSQNLVCSQTTLAGFHGHPTYGIHVANTGLAVPASISQVIWLKIL